MIPDTFQKFEHYTLTHANVFSTVDIQIPCFCCQCADNSLCWCGFNYRKFSQLHKATKINFTKYFLQRKNSEHTRQLLRQMSYDSFFVFHRHSISIRSVFGLSFAHQHLSNRHHPHFFIYVVASNLFQKTLPQTAIQGYHVCRVLKELNVGETLIVLHESSNDALGGVPRLSICSA